MRNIYGKESNMYQQLRPAILSLWTTLAAASNANAQAPAVLSVDPAMQTVTAGTDFTVDVDVANVKNLNAFQFDLSFDPSVIAAVSSTEGTFLTGGGNTTFFVPGANDNVGGAVTATADTLIGPVSGVNSSGGKDTLVAFTFEALKSGATTSIGISNEILLDANGAIIADSTSNGSVTVSGSTMAAPEIGAPSALSALTLLLGGLVVLRGGRCANTMARGPARNVDVEPAARRSTHSMR